MKNFPFHNSVFKQKQVEFHKDWVAPWNNRYRSAFIKEYCGFAMQGTVLAGFSELVS